MSRRGLRKRTLRHPVVGDRRYPRPRPPRRAPRPSARQPRMRPRRRVDVASLVASPEEVPARPSIRLLVVGAIVLALFVVMVLRLWTLQIINHQTYYAAVTANEVRTTPVPAPRGMILDRSGVELVGNQVDQQIVLSRAEAAQSPSIIGKVAALVGSTPKAVREALDNQQFSPYQPVPVMSDAPMTVVQFLQAHPEQFPGVSVQQVTERTYPLGGTVATHILGYVGAINGAELKAHEDDGYTQSSDFGQTGLENEYEQYLRGKPGEERLAVDAKGHVVRTLKTIPPQQGDTVVTNIDAGLQKEVEDALAADIAGDRKTPDPGGHGALPPATTGAAIVLDVQNGQVLAMASNPSFDLNQWVGGISTANYEALQATCNDTSASQCPLENYALQGRYAPGSTFKMITATAALRDGIIGAGTYVNDTGTYTVKPCTSGCTFHDDDNEALGEVDLGSALTESSDFYFYYLGDLFWQARHNPAIGPEGIQNVAKEYGLDSRTGIDLPGEGVGFVDSPSIEKKLHDEYPKDYPYGNQWYVGQNIEMAFGQGGTVLTPLQMANAYATFANGGTRYQPQVANEIVDPTTGKVVRKFTPKVEGTVALPPSVRDPILGGLQGVLQSPHGTAYTTFESTPPAFDLSSFPLAGKTGTASKNGLEPTAWFVAFGPVPNPRYVVLVTVDQGGYGANAAAPAVKAIYQYLQANPVPTEVQPPPQGQPPATTLPPSNPPAGVVP